jgi:hypothetical protein
VTVPLADTIEDLTAGWFTSALREGGALEDGSGVESARSELYGTGQFGSVVRSELEGPGAPASVIVKLPSGDAGSRQLGIAIGAYEAEVRFYEEVAPQVGVSIPRRYWGGVEPGTGRFTLVLEDLSGCAEVGDAIAGGTPEQAAAALRELVKLQAPVWNDPGLRKLDWLASAARTQMLFDVVGPALPLFRERFASKLDPEYLALVERLGPKAASYPAKAWTDPLVVVHGDYRLDNLMFATDSEPLSATVLDWQGTRLGPPLIDVAIHLGSSLSPEDRRAHQDELLRGYHDGLLAAGVEGFTLEDCRESYRRCSLYTFLLSIGISVTIARTERGDEMWAAMLSMSADLVNELGAADFLD